MASADPDEQSVLEIRDFATRFYTDEGAVKAVDGSSFDLYGGEMLGIVGEPGSGKSMTALSILQLVGSPGRIERGSVQYRGNDLFGRSEAEMWSIRGNGTVMMFQNPTMSLGPVFTVGDQIGRVIKTHRDVSGMAARKRAIEPMADVGIPEPTSCVDNYPHQFPGKMRQRALLAMTISCEPDVLIADEPTTTLDVTIEMQIFNVLDELQEKHGMSIILITHDLGVVAGTCDHIVVAYDGRVVERAGVDDLFGNPWHPYTHGPVRSIPRLADGTNRLMLTEGDMPNPTDLPSSCSFYPRCPYATAECESYDPELREVEPDREVACLHVRGHDPLPSAIETEHAEADGGGPAVPAIDGGTSQ